MGKLVVEFVVSVVVKLLGSAIWRYAMNEECRGDIKNKCNLFLREASTRWSVNLIVVLSIINIAGSYWLGSGVEPRDGWFCGGAILLWVAFDHLRIRAWLDAPGSYHHGPSLCRESLQHTILKLSGKIGE